MSAFRKLYRSLLIGLLIIIGLILTLLLLRNTIPQRGLTSRIITSWLGLVARSLGAKISCYGTALNEKTLFVANHISWLDILVLGSLVPVHFLSKAEVRTLPVLGWLATRAGTLYIKRGCKFSASDASSEITAALNKKHNSLVFAEGTTTNGHIKKFHSRLMQSSIDAHAMVQPVAIFYPKLNPVTHRIEVNPDALFIGNTSYGESFDLISRAPHIEVEVHFLKPIDSTGLSRNAIARHAFDEVVEAIKSIKRRQLNCEGSESI